MTELEKNKKSKRQVLAALLAAGVGLSAGIAWRWYSQTSHDQYVHPDHPAFSDPAWQSDIVTPQKTTFKLSDYAGKKLVINFWATWCPPCVEELPLLNQFYQEQKGNDWVVIALAIDKPASVEQFLERTALSFPIGVGGLELMTLSQKLGNLSGSLPFSMVIDSKGNVIQRKIGQVKEADLQAWKSVK